MEYLYQIATSTAFPLMGAFVLGVMMAISPCPLATNISAIVYISRDITEKKRMFYNGLLYTLGDALTYTLIVIILIFMLTQGASAYRFRKTIITFGEYMIGPFLILKGLFMFDVLKVNFSSGGWPSRIGYQIMVGSYRSALLLGVVFALAFCPYSGFLFFGMLMPLAIASPHGYSLPFIFGIATGLPVILFAFLLAFPVSGIGLYYKKVKIFEFWFRRVAVVVFLAVGAWFVWMVFLK